MKLSSVAKLVRMSLSSDRFMSMINTVFAIFSNTDQPELARGLSFCAYIVVFNQEFQVFDWLEVIDLEHGMI